MLLLLLLPPQCCCCSSSMLLRMLLLLLLLLSCSSRYSPPRSFSRCRPLLLSFRRPRSLGRSVCRLEPAWPLAAALARVARVIMGKRGNRSVASSAGDGDLAASGAEDDDDDLTSRVRRWKIEHPARDYVGQPLQQVHPSNGLGSGTLAHSVRNVPLGKVNVP